MKQSSHLQNKYNITVTDFKQKTKAQDCVSNVF